jgi:hypothetical protein
MLLIGQWFVTPETRFQKPQVSENTLKHAEASSQRCTCRPLEPRFERTLHHKVGGGRLVPDCQAVVLFVLASCLSPARGRPDVASVCARVELHFGHLANEIVSLSNERPKAHIGEKWQRSQKSGM